MNTPRKQNFWQRKLAGVFIVLINDAVRSFCNRPDERQENGDMKQLTVQDHVKHMELLRCLEDYKKQKMLKYQTSRLRGKGCFYSLQTWGFSPDEKNSSKRQHLLTNGLLDSRAKCLWHSWPNNQFSGPAEVSSTEGKHTANWDQVPNPNSFFLSKVTKWEFSPCPLHT